MVLGSQLGQTRGHRCFTILELLVVLSIIAVITALLMPSLARAKEYAYRVKCLNNLHQMGIAQHNYANDHSGWFWTSSLPPVTPLWGSSGVYPGDNNPLEGLSNYLIKSELLYCPSPLRKSFVYSPPAFSIYDHRTIQAWGELHLSSTHYGYVGYLHATLGPNYILSFENPTFLGRRNYYIDTTAAGGYCYINKRQSVFGSLGNAVRPDGTTVIGPSISMGVVGPAIAHNGEGSHVMFVDGRVSWQTGDLIGPFYGVTDAPPGRPALTEARFIGSF